MIHYPPQEEGVVSEDHDLFGEINRDRVRQQNREKANRYAAANREKVRARGKQYRENNLIKEQQRNRRYYEENRERYRDERQKRWKSLTKEERQKQYKARREWVKQNPERVKAYRLKYAYDVSIADYPKPNACPCCGEQAKLVFDHCHRTGKPRGWLCEACNKMLGWANDEIWRLEAAVNYIRTHHPENQHEHNHSSNSGSGSRAASHDSQQL
jgi:hypothetical protein